MTTAPPVVSVVIPAFDAGRTLAECLDSVFAQAGDFRLEVIVVDDGSRDATGSIAEARAGVTVLRQPNRGPAAARNAGITAARGELIAFLDADDLWPEAKLARALAVLAAAPQAAMVFADCRQFDARGPFARTEFEAAGLGAARWGGGPLVPDAYRALLGAGFVTTGSVVARGGALRELGGFDASLRLVEDLELWLRIARTHPIAWSAEVGLHRRRHAASASRDPEAMGRAYLEVLARQRGHGLDAEVRRLAAAEHLALSRLAAARGDRAAALAHARRGLAERATLRGLVRYLGARLRGLGDNA